MNHHPTTNTTSTLTNPSSTSCDSKALLTFLKEWDLDYQQQVRTIPLFDLQQNSQWTQEQRHRFVRLFYHARGHFYRFLWLLGNEAPNKTYKDLILANIDEEFGGHARSHEQLYDYFAEAMGVDDIPQEYIHDTHHIAELQQFNRGHLIWLNEHDWPHKWAAFSAYERLDNIDYINLLALVRSLGITDRGLAFFRVHQKAKHFDATYQELLSIWEQSADSVKKAFAFIQRHQLELWRCLSNALSTQ